MELTPEVFEKAEFDERRRGYDIDQVETFLEETGTALARLLVQVRKNEDRLTSADATLSEADAAIEAARTTATRAEERAKSADARAQAAEGRLAALEAELAAIKSAPAPAAPVAVQPDLDEEIKQATSTLVMAQKTADSTIHEAQLHAEGIVDAAQAEADKILESSRQELANATATARQRADDEYGSRRNELLAQIGELEHRREVSESLVESVEAKLRGRYSELDTLIDSLSALREGTDIESDEPAEDAAPKVEVTQEPIEERVTEAVVPEGQPDVEVEVEGLEPEVITVSSVDDEIVDVVNEESAVVEGRPAPVGFDVVDLTGDVAVVESAESETWAPGSWSALEDELGDETDEDVSEHVEVASMQTQSSGPVTTTQTRTAAPRAAQTKQATRRDVRDVDLEHTQAVPVADVPPKDRFLEELDSAVNEAVPHDDDDAMKAFFEGSADPKARRFGWRR